MNNEEILQAAFDIIMNFERRLKNLECITGQQNRDILSFPIEHLQLTLRTENALKSQNIRNIDSLVKESYRELFEYPNLGKKSLNEIIHALDKLSLKLISIK